MSRAKPSSTHLHLPRFHSPKQARGLIATCAVVFSLMFIWAAIAQVDEVTRGEGRIIPSRQMQIVQAPERGIVSALYYYEGEIVEQGAVLVKLDNTGFSTQLGELKQKKYALQARLARLTAESTQARIQLDQTGVPPDISVFFERELEVYEAQKNQLSAEVAVLNSQYAQKEQAHKQLEAEAIMLSSNLSIVSRELEINQKLFERGVLPEIELLRLKRQYTTLNGERQMLSASLASAISAKNEAIQRIISTQTAFTSKAQSDLAATKAELAVIEERLRGAADRVDRSALVAPMRGVINKLSVSTIGAVVQAGEPLVEIVPLEDTLLVSAQIQPQHVAFLHPGQNVSVKVTAYDYSIYGGLEGVLERISPDTREDERGKVFFKVIVRTKRNYLGPVHNPLPITPGMTASIDILTGKKSVLSYIAKPLIKVKAEAFRER
ncbi:Type I secretion system membrane fusion protein PrsE [Pseudovibrio axinellae]|uniref:Membrane fusion protein (MFP) family protein n=1 Tax=Pseudovibrio axinellae TaxID=989403 RepID=A0A161X8I0_9HYPH|nr:HlyD family type I secretion periplasmic adaptor subunit [Pseudovibrio axinellae]KZL05441.1 Type I secretion system membrane fusion protein PrsE [Pseudovibrio axinellae]SEP99077.1 membrane fusion protein, adhesin transport system [Pseudovibrio axinellae]